MNQNFSQIEQRKNDHIDICLSEQINAQGITTGFEKYRFQHQPLPEVNYAEVDLSTSFLGSSIQAPFLVSSMTGGTEKAWEINKRLATIAEAKGWPMGLGSQRAALENESLQYSFRVREVAPTIPLIANLGAIQLNYGYTADHCRKAIDMVQANALVLHLNSLQEVFQPEGNVNFKNLLNKIEAVCRKLEVPVGVKEVGWGIHGEIVDKLMNCGIQFIDVAGAGGTSWSQVEKHRTSDPVVKQAAETFSNWGTPTADCIIDVKQRAPECTIVGSGGINNGLDAAKAIKLGADVVGMGKVLLSAAVHSEEQLLQAFERLELELKIAMFGTGVDRIERLKTDSVLVRLT